MGTTTAVDTSQVNHTPEHSDAGIRALQESGLRVVYAYSRGAGAGARFRHVTLPMLAPTLFFVGVMTLIGDLQLFAEPYVMTRGGPSNATLSIVLYMYEQGFRWWNMGYAAAIAFVLFGVILVPTLLHLALRRRVRSVRRGRGGSGISACQSPDSARGTLAGRQPAACATGRQ